MQLGTGHQIEKSQVGSFAVISAAVLSLEKWKQDTTMELLGIESPGEFPNNITTTTMAPVSFLRKGQGVRAIVGVTCVLSIIGSSIIILSYFLFRDLRTNARLILVHLSLCDLGVSLANLCGDSIDFGLHFNLTNGNRGELRPLRFEYLCKTQAFIAHYFTISSVLWTLMLATYMYAVTTKLSRLSKKENRWFNICSCITSYGVSLGNCVWLLLTHRLGYSPANTSGWCGSIMWKVAKREVDYMAIVFGYDIWIGLTCIFIIVIYLALLIYVRQEKKKRPDFREVARNIDYKFILIPVTFVLLRVWSFIVHILLESEGHGKTVRPKELHHTLIYLAGIGDSGQGAANAILFVIFTHNVRQRYIKMLCCCFRKSKEDEKRVLVVNSLDSSISSVSYKAISSVTPSDPMYIKKSTTLKTKKIPMMAKSCDTSTTYGSIPSSDSS